MHLQQVQQKQERLQLLEAHPVTNADAEFRRGLEELVQDHLNTCMALASCSSAHDTTSRSSGGNALSTSSSLTSLQEDSSCLLHEQHLECANEHQNHPEVLLVDVHKGASSSHCCQNLYQNILVDQLEEEHDEGGERGREGLVQSQQQLFEDHIGTSHSSDALSRQQSSIMHIWDSRKDSMITTLERQSREAELLALAGLHTVSMLDASFLKESSSPRAQSALERPQRRASSLVQMWRDIECEQGAVLNRSQSTDQPMAWAAETEADTQSEAFYTRDQEELRESIASLAQSSGPNQSPSPSSEPVAVVIEEIMHVNQRAWEVAVPYTDGVLDNSSQDFAGVLGYGAGERERVRQIVQTWMRGSGMEENEAMSSGRQNNRDPGVGHNEQERVRQLGRPWVQTSSQPDFEARDGSQQSGIGATESQQDILLESNSFGCLDPQQLRQGFGMDREHDTHRVLQLLMRTEGERQWELDRLLDLRAVSQFSQRSRLQSLLRGRFLRTISSNAEHRTRSSASRELGQLQQQRAVSRLREGFRFRLETIVRGQVNSRSLATPMSSHAPFQRRRQQEVANYVEGPGHGMSTDWQAVAAAQRVDSEATSYSTELRELLGRRSVTTILASDFRDRLDQLIRSLIHRQARSPRSWPWRSQQQEQAGAWPDTSPLLIPSPPPPLPPQPPQPAWQHVAWTQPSVQRTRDLEWEVGSNFDLRKDIAQLHQGMSEMRRLLEACMDMQYELQRSVRQEVAGALQQMYAGKDIPEEALDGSQWGSVKKGTCCICCDKHINSLLYRCGHMCTCLQCANEMLQNSGKCPMCRAPIVEVLRAFTIA